MNQRLGLQLYSVRNELAVEFENTLRKIAEIGFSGVELAGLHANKPEFVARLLQKHQLLPIAMHCNLLTSDGLKRSLDEAEALNCPNLVCPWCLPHTFESEKSINQLAEKLNIINQFIQARGKRLLYHNHNFEFQRVNRQRAFDIFAAHLDPSIDFELDIYLAVVANTEPVDLLQSYADRIEIYHLKDGKLSLNKINTAIGDGVMNYSLFIDNLIDTTKWCFIEIENCETNVMEAIKKSKSFCDNLINRR